MPDLYRRVDYRRGYLDAIATMRLEMHNIFDRVIGPLTARATQTEVYETLDRIEKRDDYNPDQTVAGSLWDTRNPNVGGPQG